MFKALTNVGGDLNKHIMKSRIKIDYTRGIQNHPVIKIITPPQITAIPTTPGSNEDIEEEVQDRLVRDLLHSPCKCDPNGLFEVKETFPLDSGAHLTTIGAIQEEDVLHVFRYAILNRYIPYNDILEMNREFGMECHSDTQLDSHINFKNAYLDVFKKIHGFFNWLDKTEQAAWEERHPYVGAGKQVKLKEISAGNSFYFGGVRMFVDKASKDEEGMVFCQIDGKEAYVYIAEDTIVEVEN